MAILAGAAAAIGGGVRASLSATGRTASNAILGSGTSRYTQRRQTLGINPQTRKPEWRQGPTTRTQRYGHQSWGAFGRRAGGVIAAGAAWEGFSAVKNKQKEGNRR